jgi:N-acylglucosamine 2-epimerase
MDVIPPSGTWSLVVENVNSDGSLSDSFEGRQITPGHAIEAMWFIMDLGVRLNRPALIEKAVETTLKTLDYGWDKEYGGIFYFLTVKDFHPSNWNGIKNFGGFTWKRSSLSSRISTYRLSRMPHLVEKIHDYTWSHFKDPEYPEWWGYLNRRGEVLLD